MIFSVFDQPVLLLLLIPTLFIALPVHEYFHALAATKLGDPTPSALGRLTIAPWQHLDPWGALALLLFGFGWAKPVPIDPRYFKKPKRDMAIVAAAGPLSNLIMSLIAAILYLASLRTLQWILPLVSADFLPRFFYYLAQFFYVFHLVNLTLFVFNLIPISPLDGSHVLALILPARINVWIERHRRDLYVLLMLWLLFGSVACRYLLRIPAIGNSVVLSRLVKILSLSGLVSSATSHLSAWILKLFSFIPFL